MTLLSKGFLSDWPLQCTSNASLFLTLTSMAHCLLQKLTRRVKPLMLRAKESDIKSYVQRSIGNERGPKLKTS